MKELNQYRDNMLNRFENIIGVLREAGLKISEVQWHVKLGDDFTPHQYLARLAALQINENLPVIKHFLNGEKGRMAIFDEQAWLKNDYRVLENWFEIFESFAGTYRQVINKLGELEKEKWAETARHPMYGERTLQWWVERSLASMEETLRAFEKVSK